MCYLFMIICLFLDYIYPFSIPSFFNKLNLFYPMFTLTYLVFLYKKISYKEYNKLIIITGILYDLLFSYLFLFNTLAFILFNKILKKIEKYFRLNIILQIIILIMFIVLYDSILFILVYISKYNNVNINDLVYKISHSIILNILYYFWLVIIFGNKRLKLKK